MCVLVTGFEANDDGLNASQLAVESLRDDPPAELCRWADLIDSTSASCRAWRPWGGYSPNRSR